MSEQLKRSYVSAIIPAAGQGTRMKTTVNKQYLSLKGKTILSYTLDVFEKCPLVDEIVVVINANEVEVFRKKVLHRGHYKKIRVVFGGKTRQESVYNGLMALNPKCDLVMIHDGARPLVGESLLIKCIYETLKYNATIVAVPAKNTIKVVNSEGIVQSTPDRKKLFEVQTPQTFKLPLILEAHKKAAEDGFLGTDDASLLERLGEKVKIIRGHYNNIKITTPEDLMIASAMISTREDL